MTTDDVDPYGHVGDQPLPVIYFPAVPRGHNHDDEHVIGENKSVGLIEGLRRAAESPDPSRRLVADGRAGSPDGRAAGPGSAMARLGEPGPPDPGSRRGRRWLAVVALCLGLVVLIGLMLVPTFERQRQYTGLRAHGVTTTATIAYCATAGSNRPASVTVTCPGTFELDGAPVTEDILGLPRPLQTGDRVVVMVDPYDPHTVYPLADVRDGYHTGWLTGDTAVAAMALVLLVLVVFSQVRVVRRGRSPGRAGAGG